MRTPIPHLPTLVALATLLAFAALGGCAQTSPGWDARFGDAARQANAAQTVDPAAPTRHTTITGVDGKAAAGAMKAYADSYGYAVKESKPPVVALPTTGSR